MGGSRNYEKPNGIGWDGEGRAGEDGRKRKYEYVWTRTFSFQKIKALKRFRLGYAHQEK